MKTKKTFNTLALTTETLRSLQSTELANVVGGKVPTDSGVVSCDTIGAGDNKPKWI